VDIRASTVMRMLKSGVRRGLPWQGTVSGSEFDHR
jgi:hypothetical protein